MTKSAKVVLVLLVGFLASCGGGTMSGNSLRLDPVNIKLFFTGGLVDGVTQVHAYVGSLEQSPSSLNWTVKSTAGNISAACFFVDTSGYARCNPSCGFWTPLGGTTISAILTASTTGGLTADLSLTCQWLS